MPFLSFTGKQMPDYKHLIEEFSTRFYADALAYYLHFESSERRLPQDVKNALKEKYGKKIFMPIVNWRKDIGDFTDSDAFDTAITAYLEAVNYDQEKFVLPKNRLLNMLWNKARSEGKKIIDDAEKQ